MSVSIAVAIASVLLPRCTPVPALYQDWKSKTPWSQQSDSVARHDLNAYRSGVTFDPFDTVIVSNADTRAGLHERVLWEDDSVVVIVAKPSLPRDVLVVPKREMMFPVDASNALLEQLARVAAATSDAFIRTAGKTCRPELAANIFINPPGAIGVRHLHVHVQPPANSIAFKDEDAFYARMSRSLKEALSTPLDAHARRHSRTPASDR